MFYITRKHYFITLLFVVSLILCLSIGFTGCSKEPAVPAPQEPQKANEDPVAMRFLRV